MGNRFLGELRVSAELAIEHRQELIKRYKELTLCSLGKADGNHLGLRVRDEGTGKKFLLFEIEKEKGEDVPRTFRFPVSTEEDPPAALEQRRAQWVWLTEASKATVLRPWE